MDSPRFFGRSYTNRVPPVSPAVDTPGDSSCCSNMNGSDMTDEKSRNLTNRSRNLMNLSRNLTNLADKDSDSALPPTTSATEEKMKRLKLGDREILAVSQDKVERILYGSIGAFLGFNLLSIPFILPKCRMFLGAPYLPTRKKTVDAIFDTVLEGYLQCSGGKNYNVGGLLTTKTCSTSPTNSISLTSPLKKHISPELPNIESEISSKTRLLDIGSGDGRIVIAGAKRGYNSTGVEINPYLYTWSQLNRYRYLNREERKLCSFRFGNIWNVDFKSFFGDYDVITFYGRPGDEVMKKIGEVIQIGAKKETLIVSNQFDFPGWETKLVKLHDDLRLYDLS